jgi:DNA mismatch repair protein MSH5
MVLKKRPKGIDFQNLMRFAYYTLKIKASFHDHSNEVPKITLIQEVLQVLNEDVLRSLGASINSVVDFDESEAEDRVVVKPNVDPELDELKRTFAGLDDFLVCLPIFGCFLTI